SGNNSYSGPTVVNSSLLTAQSSTALGNNSAVVLANVSGVQLNLSSNVSIGSLAGGGSNGGNVSLSNTLTVGGDNTSTTFSGQISGFGAGLTKVGSGTLILAGSNSYGGTTTISAGTLQLGSGGSTGSIGSGAITDNGTLAFNLS